ncbi:GTPase family protein [Saccharospirillum impatiens]|uniref:GTPase family protein n=1 Tax=Saccharospirillum impatiens TaxID=169438 RepID=UPI0003F7EB2C|nr:GTPase [Saccharospirillum impatiens]
MTAKPKPRRQGPLILVIGLVLLLMLLPLVLLIPLGGLWLWQQGWLLYWLVFTALLTGGGYGLVHLLQRRLAGNTKEPTEDTEPVSPPEADWSPQEMAAWAEVQQLARDTDKIILGSQTLLLQRARVVIEQVARHYYPDHKDPIWNFTLPEVLLLSERVSLRLRLVLGDHVPGSSHIQVGQVMRLWHLGSASQSYYKGAKTLYRLVRVVNPVSAVLAEVRERLLNVAFDRTTDYLQQKGARIWVEEVGRAAIDLYSGRLQADAGQMARLAGQEQTMRPPPGPVQVLVAGQLKVGKSSLVNALLDDTQSAVDVLPMTARAERYQLSDETGEPLAMLTDTPGVSRELTAQEWGAQLEAVDCILWVVSAHRADRALDRQSLDAIRDWFRNNPSRRQPPILGVVSHIDRLSPAREWSPPYDLDAPASLKATAIKEALQQIATDLALPVTDLVPVRLDQGAQGYNLDLLWSAVYECLEQARHGRAQRLNRLARKRDWKAVMRQARGAGRLIRQGLNR